MALPDELFEASYGTIRLFAAEVETDNGRDQVIHPLARGDAHPLQDRGLKPRISTLQLIFDDMQGEPVSGIRRFRQFKEIVDSGDMPQLYRHPIDGSYNASVGDFTYRISDSSVVTATVQFIADDDVKPISPTSASSGTATAEGAVDQAVATFAKSMLDVGIDTDLGDQAAAAQDRWLGTGDDGADPVPTRQVLVDVAQLITGLEVLIVDAGMEDDLQLWPALRDTLLLMEAVRGAALAATSDSAAQFTVRIGEASRSLLALCVSVYGAAQAEDRMRQVSSLNDISTVAWIDPGTQLVMPAKSISPRANL